MRLRLSIFPILFLIFLGLSGCSLFDKRDAQTITDNTDILKALRNSVDQVMAVKPLYWASVSTESVTLDSWISSTSNMETVIDLITLTEESVDGQRLFTSVTPTVSFQEQTTVNFQETSAVLTRDLVYTQVVSANTNYTRTTTTVTGNIVLLEPDTPATLNITSLTHTLVETVSSQNVMTGYSISFSLPVTYEYEGSTETKTFTGTLSGSATRTQNALIVDGDFKNSSNKFRGSLELKWAKADYYPDRVPVSTVRDELDVKIP